MNMNTTETPTNQQFGNPLVNPLGIERNLRIKEVIEIVGISRATIYRMMDKFTFPTPIKISSSLIAWRPEDLRQYMQLGPDGWFEQFGCHQRTAKLARQGDVDFTEVK